jgi:hypothetical protein
MRGTSMRRANSRGRGPLWLLLAPGLAPAGGFTAPAAMPADLVAEPPSQLSVTVYRAPDRESGSIDLNHLQGFALVSETRTVHLPAGVHRIRFEGVADGIEPASAIITGFPSGVIEKNREGKLLSPASLIAATVGKSVTLLRTNKKTGQLTRVAGTILSDAGGGVVFQAGEEIEALRCSGLPETFSFTGVTDLASSPTLSVLVRSPTPITRAVTLSYLSYDFDWAADYTATLSADGKSMDLGAWVTVGNGNGVGFPAAHTQVVAGRVNRESGEVRPLDPGGPILAQCWPRGSTSDFPAYLQLAAGPGRDAMSMRSAAMAAPAALEEIMVTAAQRVQQEQLGDLKLYRIPERTTVASRQSKQVRLLDREAIPVNFVYSVDLAANQPLQSTPAAWLLRTMNTSANHLGLPLPSGRIAVFAARGESKLLLHESNLRDLAVGEEVEFSLGESPDIEVTVTKESTQVDSAGAQLLPLVPGVVSLRSVKVDEVNRVTVSNARSTAAEFELRLSLPPGARIVRADHALTSKRGRPLFRLDVAANQSVTLRYQTQGTETRPTHE